MVILRSVLEVEFTKYCACAAESPGGGPELSRLWTGVCIILELEAYMLKEYLGYNKILSFFNSNKRDKTLAMKFILKHFQIN